MNNEIRFCEKCGRQLNMSLVGAERLEKWRYDGGETMFTDGNFHKTGSNYKPYGPYNEKTGKRQLIPLYSCPQGETWLGSLFNHDRYLLEKVT